MNGAEALIRSLTSAGVEVCFANPGTSEMHLVQAMDGVPAMRGVLALFEGVCTGAADGYGRMTGKPATTLLHLGPGLGNGIANLHNARRAGTPIINLIGNHALYHVTYDAPLTSDIDTLAKNVSSWIKSDSTADSLAADAMAALQSSLQRRAGSGGQISTMIIPADACWNETEALAETLTPPSLPTVDDKVISDISKLLDNNALLLLDKGGLSIKAREAAARIAGKFGCRVALSTFPARVDGGPGTPVIERMPYFPEHVLGALKGVSNLVLAGADSPVSFFAYPGTPSELVPEGCEVTRLADGGQDVEQALLALADLVDAPADFKAYEKSDGRTTEGELSTGAVATILAAHLPEGAILCGDSGGGGAAFDPVQRSAANTWLNLTGGSIGQGGPCAVGAAVAAPDRRVFALLGDGASMYTNQAFWTQAREGLDVTTIIFNNSKYGILETEYLRLGVNEVGARAAELFDLSRPDIDFASLAGAMGVPGGAASNCAEFEAHLQRSISQPGPYIIQANV